MNERLEEIIRYKTGGKKIPFAELMGWSPQYLSKMLRGENFGVQPILTVLEKLPEINARWFLFGTGEMLEIGKLFSLQRETMNHIQALLDLDKYIPYMSGEEVREFENAVREGRKPVFTTDAESRWQERLTEREKEINERFRAANLISEEQCRQKTAKR